MDFNNKPAEYPSFIHQKIFTSARRLNALLPLINAVEDSAMRESCTALYEFAIDMFSDMYDNPEVYHLPAGKLEEFIGDRTMLEARRAEPDKYKKIEAEVRHATGGYIRLLMDIGLKGEIDGACIAVSMKNMPNIGIGVKKGSVDTLVAALSRVGLTVQSDYSTGLHRFSFTKHENILPALCEYSSWLDCIGDLRAIRKKPTHDDHYCALIDEQRDLVYELHNYATQRKIKITTNANWGVNYHYKSEHLMTFKTGDDIGCFLSVNVSGGFAPVLEAYLEKELPDFRKKVVAHISGCDTNQCVHCSTYGSGRYVTVLGKTHQACGGSDDFVSFIWREPAAEDAAMIRRLIDIRCEIIEAKKSDNEPMVLKRQK